MAKKDCPACKGSGDCKQCDGKGHRGRAMFGMGMQNTCAKCEGSGRCTRCGGSGVVPKD